MENSVSKQAYLIIAHKDDLVFRTLLAMLDDVRNDIFIHMDVKNTMYNPAAIEKSVSHSCIIHTERTNVAWGGYSQINAEMILLRVATQHGRYNHYHLLSGSDLPIKSQDFIYSFFMEHDGVEFVRFEKMDFQYESRIQYYHLFQENIGRTDNLFLRGMNLIFLKVQKLLGIKRNKNINFQKGTNWFSITDDLARYVVSKSEWIENTFKNSFCCDEVFLQTLIVNSDFKDRLYHKEFDNNTRSIMRLIDWNRGKPYTFRISDKDELISSDMIFARKFDLSIDSDIIEFLERKFT